MCTVSWWRRPGKLSVRFNRDEQRGRVAAEAPMIDNGLIWPRDPQGGGTWICVDAQGTVHCLLNNYNVQDVKMPLRPRSRGALPLLSAQQSLLPLCDGLKPEAYPPFHLLRLPLEGEIEHVIWDSHSLQPGPVHSDLTHWTTSGWNSDAVVAARAALFKTYLETDGLSEAALHRFHFAMDPQHPGRWPCMQRAEARTVSFSEISVNEKEIYFRYTPLHDEGLGTVSVLKSDRVP